MIYPVLKFKVVFLLVLNYKKREICMEMVKPHQVDLKISMSMQDCAVTC